MAGLTEIRIDLDSYYNDLFEALFSFDEEQIRNHLEAYNIQLSEDEEDGLWHHICELLCEMAITPEDIRELAEEWLIAHGYRKKKGRRY